MLHLHLTSVVVIFVATLIALPHNNNQYKYQATKVEPSLAEFLTEERKENKEDESMTHRWSPLTHRWSTMTHRWSNLMTHRWSVMTHRWSPMTRRWSPKHSFFQKFLVLSFKNFKENVSIFQEIKRENVFIKNTAYMTERWDVPGSPSKILYTGHNNMWHDILKNSGNQMFLVRAFLNFFHLTSQLTVVKKSVLQCFNMQYISSPHVQYAN